MARQRNYKAEYARRIARGLEQGLSRSQARGHPRHHEPYTAEIAKVRPWDPRLEEGLKQIRDGRTMAASARSIGVAPERLRSYVTRTGVARKVHTRWSIGPDHRMREMLVYSEGRAFVVRLPGYEEADAVGRFMAAVGEFVESNDPLVLEPFVGQGVTDANGKWVSFETRPNVLYRLDETEGDSFEDAYRILAA